MITPNPGENIKHKHEMAQPPQKIVPSNLPQLSVPYYPVFPLIGGKQKSILLCPKHTRR